MVIKTICCVCQKTKGVNGWSFQYVDKHEILSHGYCPDCFHEALASVKLYAFHAKHGEKAGHTEPVYREM